MLVQGYYQPKFQVNVIYDLAYSDYEIMQLCIASGRLGFRAYKIRQNYLT